MRRVFVCSPYRGDVIANVALARRTCREVLARGDAPFAPHLLYPEFLDDADAAERDRGIGAGLVWLAVADEVLVVGNPTDGMRREIAAAEALGLPVRQLPAGGCANTPRAEPPPRAVRALLRGEWGDRLAPLVLVLVGLGFLLLPGCVAPACRSTCPAPTSR